MNTISKKAAVVGIYEYPLRYAPPDANEIHIQAECAINALSDAGLTLKDVDALYASGFGMMETLTMAEYLSIKPTHLGSSNIGGASFVSNLGHAAMAISAGICKVALISYCHLPLIRNTRLGPASRSPLVKGPDAFEEPFGSTLIGAYAMAAQRHAFQYGSTSAQRAEISVATRKWASMNPDAMYQKPITIESVLNSRMIASPLTLLECCVISDGGGAVVVTSSERAHDLKQKPVYVLGWGESTNHSTGMSQVEDLTRTPANITGPIAFNMAGVKPEDIDVAELYDSFTITVLLTLEGLGFCAKGEGGNFVSGQRTAPGGSFPVNTDGGGLSSNHPGMRGIFLIIEATRQLRGKCGVRQVKDARLALIHGSGGLLSSGVTLILSNE